MGKSKIIYGGDVLMDLTGDTVIADKLLKGYTAHDKAGDPVVGTCEFDVDSSNVTASDAEVLKSKTYAKGGEVRTGSMPNNGAVNGAIATKDGTYTVPLGYHDGSGRVGISDTEKAKLVAANIRQNVTILGVTGTMSTTEGVNAQSKEVTPSTKEQLVLPDTEEGFNTLSQVIVQPIPYVESENAAGGITVTIG